MAEMSDNTNNTVTISADYFAELYRRANEPKTQMVECKGECQYLKAVAKERDELKAKLDETRAHYCTNSTGRLDDACKVAALCRENEAKLADAERCIDTIEKMIDCDEADNTVGKIIRAWRENREAK